MTTTGQRLREERERLGLSQSALALIAGVGKSTQINYEGDKRRPDSDYLEAVADSGVDVLYVVTGGRASANGAAASVGDAAMMGRALGGEPVGVLGAVSAHLSSDGPPSWLGQLASDEGATHSGGSQAPSPHGPEMTVRALLPHSGPTAVRPLVLSLPLGDGGGQKLSYQVIPKHMRPASAGYGGGVASPDQPMDLAGDLAFTFEWLRRNLGHTSGHLASVQVRGDSMASTLLDGETIMIDQSAERVDVDGIYVLELYGRRVVKRVQHLYDGTLVLISDNQSYQRETIPRDRARDVRVIGRMVWPRVR